MYSGALRALEFDRIVEAVCRFAQTPPGRAKLARLEPLSSVDEVRAALAATSETVQFLAENHIGLQAPDDLDIILGLLAVEGRALDPLQLRALGSFLTSIDSTCATIRRAKSAFPVLRSI